MSTVEMNANSGVQRVSSSPVHNLASNTNASMSNATATTPPASTTTPVPAKQDRTAQSTPQAKCGDRTNAKPRVVQSLRQALDALHCQRVTSAVVDELATLICMAMSTPHRVYHATTHVFDLFVCAETQPIACLAGLFHDVVYLQIDDGVHPLVMDRLTQAGVLPAGNDSGAFGEPRPKFSLNLDTPSLSLSLCRAIFGWADSRLLETGQQGVNEFLSAVLAAQCLQGHIPPRALFEVVICIEATIPFRGPAVYDELMQRALAATSILPELKDTYTAHDAKLAVEVACIVAERDVGNFASTDTRCFLGNSWKLLPEIHRSLRDAATFTFADYAKAMLANVRFYLFLQSDPTRVFHQFGSCRTRGEYQRLISLTTRNLNIGIEFGRTKLIAACLLDALAKTLSLEHRPASWFMREPGCGIDVLGHGCQGVSWSARKRSSGANTAVSRRSSLGLCPLSSAPKARASVHSAPCSGHVNAPATSSPLTGSGKTEARSPRLHRHSHSHSPRHAAATTASAVDSVYSYASFTLAVSAPRTATASQFANMGRRKASLPSAQALRRRSTQPAMGDLFFTNLLVPSYDYVEVLLEMGMGYGARFDVDADMTSLYVHQALVTDEGVEEAAEACAEYLNGDIEAQTFLDSFERRVTALLSHCMHLHIPRVSSPAPPSSAKPRKSQQQQQQQQQQQTS